MQQWQRRILGVLALGGSFLGITLAFTLLLAPGSILGRSLVLPFLGLYCWGIWCGVRMLEDAEGAVRSNRLFWAVQIPFLTSPVAGYFFASGFLLFVTYQPANSSPGFVFRLGSQFEYSLLQPEKPFVFGVNIFALAIWVFLTYRLRTETLNEKPAH